MPLWRQTENSARAAMVSERSTIILNSRAGLSKEQQCRLDDAQRAHNVPVAQVARMRIYKSPGPADLTQALEVTPVFSKLCDARA